MIETVGFVASYLFNACWQVLFICAAAWFVVRMLRRFGPAMEHKIWVWALALSVVVPLLATVYTRFESQRWAGAILFAPRSSTGSVAARQHPHAGQVAAGLPIVLLGVALYVMVILCKVIRLSRQIYAVRKLFRSGEHIELRSTKSIRWRKISQRMGTKPIPLLGSMRVSGPMTISMSRPVILLPQAFASKSTLDAFTAALAHECAHILRRDYSKNLLYEVLSIVLAFHPIARLIKIQIARTREMICDGMVVQSVMDWQSYALALLEIAKELSVPAKAAYTPALGVVNQTDIERRILMLRQNKNMIRRAPGGLVVASAAVFLAGASLLASAWTRPLAIQRTADTSLQPAVYNKALACTYYDNSGRFGPKMKGYDGICARDKSSGRFVCQLDHDPKISQSQIACESKVLKAESAQSQ